MSTDHSDLEDDPRVIQAARDYLADLEAGRKPDRQAYYGRCPELAEAMSECFDGMELAHAAGVALRPAAPPFQPAPPEPLGDFKIVREIGRGGMGIVYEAVQMSLGRRVALKVLPFASGLDAKHLQRFKTEAHAAAQLHHTNIVPVYAVGCERGVHFYAMQIIDGRPLDSLIREWRGDNQDAGGSASTIDLQATSTVPASKQSVSATRTGRGREAYRGAARIAVQVADALEYAHDAGVVHRDIKPANLMLDAKGNVWVADFGLAQVSADAGLTQTGDVFGTLRYMSPEQASGRRVVLDHRTDVYSLGATLYELLTLQPIFPSHDRPALLHQILDEDPRPLRQHDRSIPVELETIVMKAVAKSPEDRYATAGEMAADLRRFMDEKPILARRPSLVDRSRKWMRRHPSIVAAGLLILVFSVVVLAASTAIVAREQARTKDAYDRERQRAVEADERFNLAQRSADEMIRMAEEELSNQPHLQTLRIQLLETALAYYQELIEMRRNDPAAQPKLAVTRDRVKQILDDLAVLQGSSQLVLLMDEAVLNDLGLDDDKRARVRELAAKLKEQRNDSFHDFHHLSPEERKQRFETARNNESAATSILDSEQVRRFGQIKLQCQGLTAFHDPKIVSALNLSVDQREQIRTVEAEMFFFGKHDGPGQGLGGPFGPGGPGRKEPGKGRPPKDFPPDGAQKKDGGRRRGGEAGGPPPDQIGGIPREKHEQMLIGAFEKIEKIMKPEQWNKWKEMTGKPLHGGIPFCPAGGFGPGPGGGGPGGPGGGGPGGGGPGGPGGGGPR
jgi:eukaryotic-like serine/threonine-protein kinase